MICDSTCVLTSGRIDCENKDRHKVNISMWDPDSPCAKRRGGTHFVEALGDLDKSSSTHNEQQGWIYQLLFPNGKKYVGQTVSWHRRMRGHKCGSKHDDGKIIKRAIKKTGWVNVTVSVLQCIPLDNMTKDSKRVILNEAEVKWIAELGTLKPGGYNMTPGGDYQPMDDPDVAEWQKEQVGIAMRRPEVRAKKCALWRDPSHREMMRMARAGRYEQPRRKKVEAMGIEEGRRYMNKVKRAAISHARCSFVRINGKDTVAEVEKYYDREIAEFEASLWHTRASSASDKEAKGVSASPMPEVSAKVIRIGPEDRCRVFEKDGFFYATILGNARLSLPSAICPHSLRLPKLGDDRPQQARSGAR